MKKSNKILMILGIITCLTIIGTCIYLVYNVATNEKNDITESNNDVNEQIKEPNTDTKEQELEVTEEDKNIASNLLKPFDRYKMRLLREDKLGYIYKYDKLTTENLSNDIILEVSLYKYVRENKEIYDDAFQYALSSVNINKDNFNKTVQSIFGNIKYENRNIAYDCAYGSAIYDEAQNNYIYSGQACGGVFLPYITSKIIEVKKYNDRMEVIEKIGYIGYERIDNCSVPIPVLYNHPTEKVVVEKTSCDNRDEDILFNNNLDKLLSYKYTFKKDGTNYYFEKIERVN